MNMFMLASFFICLILLFLPTSLIMAVVWLCEQSSHRLPAHLSKYEIIVVFGAHVTPHAPSPELAARLNHALYIHRLAQKPIAVSGGFSGSTSEIEIMSNYLLKCGLASEELLYLTPGSNTISSIKSMAKYSHSTQWLAVSSPYHSARLRYLALRHGMHLSACCPKLTKAKSSYLLKQRLRETLAIMKQICHDSIGLFLHSPATPYHFKF
jgi:vancomycin permeability regulator SanA